jgi:predicted nuclease with RNAse H fold
VTVVCGVDVGSFRTPAYVAWLEGDAFELESYVPSTGRPLPGDAAAYALDAPQGLPRPGRTRRAADAAAKTPTSVLPTDRSAISAMAAYGSFVEAGIAIFWESHTRGLARIPGLDGSGAPLLEAYPRFAIRRLWPDLAIPSKRKEPRRYVAELWPRQRELGLTGPAPSRHDEVDALLCALAARAWLHGRAIEVGEPPELDAAGSVIREGFIVAPGNGFSASCRRSPASPGGRLSHREATFAEQDEPPTLRSPEPQLTPGGRGARGGNREVPPAP